MLSSAANERIKEILLLETKAKARRETGLFVVEGRRLVSEVPEEALKQLYMTEAFRESPEGELLSRKGPVELVTPELMEKIADTKSPQGVLAVVRQRLRASFPEKGLLLVLERVQDPGNLGTIFRSAEAAGAAGILMDTETADPCQPKVVRGTMGAIFRLPFLVTEDLPGEVRRREAAGYTAFAAHLKGEKYYHQLAYPQNSMILLGNEGNGLSEELTALAQVKIRIPMEGRAESLNVAVAGALLAYEYHRQWF